jgi:hypothetical protein
VKILVWQCNINYKVGFEGFDEFNQLGNPVGIYLCSFYQFPIFDAIASHFDFVRLASNISLKTSGREAIF